MNKSDYIYIKAGDFFIPLVYAPNLPKETLYRWDEDEKKIVPIGGKA